MRWNVMKWNPIKKISLLLFLYHFQQIFIGNIYIFLKVRFFITIHRLGCFWFMSVFSSLATKSHFVTTSFENRKWSWFSCQIILEDFEWFVAEIERNEMKWNEMKWNEQMNPRRKICLLLNHLFENINIRLFMATNSCNFMFSFDKVLFVFIEFDLIAVTFAIAWVAFSIRDL